MKLTPYSPEQDMRYQRVSDIEFEYKYPGEGKFKPGTDLHDGLVEYLMNYARAGKRVKDGVRAQMKKMDWTLTGYVPLNEEEARVKMADPRKPVSIVFPASFSALQTFMTYMTGAFMRDPIHKYKKGKDGKQGMVNAILIERIVAKQSMWFKEHLAFNTVAQDAFKYGTGYAHISWRKKMRRVPFNQKITQAIIEATDKFLPGVEPGDVIRSFEERIMAEGSKITPIDPYKVILDPNVNPNDIQESEFFGWEDDVSAAGLVTREADPEENLFNCKYALEYAKSEFVRSTIFSFDEDGRDVTSLARDARDSVNTQFGTDMPVLSMMCLLIPKDWGLSESTMPERWMFMIAAEKFLIQAYQLNDNHNMWPIAAMSPVNDGHSVLPVSSLATTYGIQTYADWLLKSKMEFARKAGNGMYLVNNHYVDMDDLLAPTHGKVVRLTEQGYMNQQPLSNLLMSIPVQDVTTNHLNDASMMMGLLREATGTSQVDMQAMPERPTAQGVNAAETQAFSRMKYMANLISSQFMEDVGMQMAYNTIQYMSQPMQVNVVGRMAQVLREQYQLDNADGEIEVLPEDLDASFEIEHYDGNLPDHNDAAKIGEFLNPFLQIPEVAQQIAQDIDVTGAWLHMVQAIGGQDLTEFRTPKQVPIGNVSVQPDHAGSQLEQQVQAGNMVPLGALG